MNAIIYTKPTIEPISLAELKLHLRLNGGSLENNLFPKSYAVADNYTTHVGETITVFNPEVLITFSIGTVAGGSSVDVKLQDSLNGTTWSDVSGGSFTQVTSANDNQSFESSYTGAKTYLRAVAKVLGSASIFEVITSQVIINSIEDAELNLLITQAREKIENETNRALLTQTWTFNLNHWPDSDFIKVPFGNLQTIDSFTWLDTDGVATSMVDGTDYILETNGDQLGRLVLPYDESWPSGTLYPSNPIRIRFTCGWTVASDLPISIKMAALMWSAKLYAGRGEDVRNDTKEDEAIKNLLCSYKLYGAFCDY